MSNYSFITRVNADSNIVLRSTSPSSPTTLTDNQDGTSDGVVANGDSITFLNEDGFSRVGTVIGTTDNGVVIERTSFEGTIQYLATNTAYSAGAPLQNYDSNGSVSFCFLEGTLILTPEGEKTVESLKQGDQVITADGRTITIHWMGYETIRNGICTSIHNAPVKISQGAFGGGLPHSDLYVSNAHAFLLDGHLVVASALINGETITSVPFSDMPSEFAYWHIEAQDHELVVANGVAAETLSGAPERKNFDNYDSYVAQYGADRIIQPMAYPRIKDVAQMPESLLERFNLEKPALNWDELLNADGAQVVLKQANS